MYMFLKKLSKSNIQLYNEITTNTGKNAVTINISSSKSFLLNFEPFQKYFIIQKVKSFIERENYKQLRKSFGCRMN